MYDKVHDEVSDQPGQHRPAYATPPAVFETVVQKRVEAIGKEVADLTAQAEQLVLEIEEVSGDGPLAIA